MQQAVDMNPQLPRLAALLAQCAELGSRGLMRCPSPPAQYTVEQQILNDPAHQWPILLTRSSDAGVRLFWSCVPLQKA